MFFFYDNPSQPRPQSMVSLQEQSKKERKKALFLKNCSGDEVEP